MNLWIRSQDREKLISCNDIVINSHRYDTMNEHGNRIMHFKAYEIIGYFDKNTEYEILGTYETKERSLEVLNEIQNALLNKWANNVQYEIHYENEKPESLVYEMPKE